MQRLPEMPEPIAHAINQVMRRVVPLLRSEQNHEGGYRFASIDGFLSALNPLCARTGLIVLQDEASAALLPPDDTSGGGSSLWATYHFTLAHTSGATWGPLTRSVMVTADGARAFGSAQSYALKQFMRTLFQVPTGDGEDADYRRPAARETARLNGAARRGERLVAKSKDMAEEKGRAHNRRSTDHDRPEISEFVRAS